MYTNHNIRPAHSDMKPFDGHVGQMLLLHISCTPTHSIKLDEKLGFESSAGVMLSLSPLAQQTVDLICIQITMK